jgi:hypothetical protein
MLKQRFLWITVPVFVAIAGFTTFGCKGGSTTDSSQGGTTSGVGGNCGLLPAKNSEFCEATPGDLPSCSEIGKANTQVCGVALAVPEKDTLARSTGLKEFSAPGDPQVDCFAPANYPKAPETSMMVTAKGVAKIFSSGCNSHDLEVTFYKVKRGGADDGMLGDVVGTKVVTAADCMADGTAEPNDKCGTRYECNYSYPMVPTETELAIKTEGAGLWKALIQYNIFIRNGEVVTGEWTHDVRALAVDDYTTIPSVAIGGPVTNGNGVLAGEVHDCGDIRLQNAVADIDRPRVGHTYFGSDEENPLPDLSLDSTGKLGLYAAFDIVPGPVTVAAAGRLPNGDVVSLGQHRVYIYPDSVTSVTFKGMQPYQLPPAK